MSTINAQSIINEVMAAHAIAPSEYTWGDFITFRTSARGTHRIINDKAHLQRFADAVRKNAALFGGGLIREAKARPAVSYTSKSISLYKQLIEDRDYFAALQLAEEKLSPLFFVGTDGRAYMQVAPIPCDFEPRMVSVLNENGKWAIVDPISMIQALGNSRKNLRSRDAQIAEVKSKFDSMTFDEVSAIFAKIATVKPDQSAARAKWMADHGIIDDAAIEARIEENAAKEEWPADKEWTIEAWRAVIESKADQDVAEVVAQAVAVSAISEAMAPAAEDSKELVTCEAGESDANTASTGNASGFTVAAYNTVTAMLASLTPTMPPSGGNAAPEASELTTSPPPVETVHTPTVAVSTNYAADIPLSLAVNAYHGVSMSPERRGASAKAEYAQSMAEDYETLHAQAVKGGTLDLLPEVFARYRGRQAAAYRAYLASSSRCVSSFIAGPSNFPAARMNKRNDIAHKRLNDYLDGGKMAMQSAIRELRPDLRAIMAGDADAIDRLTVELEKAERAHEQMKAANKAIRANAEKGEAHQVAALMELGFNEPTAVKLLHPMRPYCKGFEGFMLTNSSANIRRLKGRLEQITAAKAKPVQSVACANGVTLEDDAPSNRVRLFFPGKPSEAIRTELKSNGFRWAPSIGAWQAYRNRHTLTTAKRMAGEPVPAAEDVQEVAEVPEAAQIEPTPPAVESTNPTATLPEGWTESAPGQMATSEDPATGGIVDRVIVTGEWFAISNATGKRVPGEFCTRAEAIAALTHATPPAAEIQPVAPVVETEAQAVPAVEAEKPASKKTRDSFFDTEDEANAYLDEHGRFGGQIAHYIEGRGKWAICFDIKACISVHDHAGHLVSSEDKETPAEPAATPEDYAKFNIRAKSGKWLAFVYMVGTVYGLRFEAAGMAPIHGEFSTHKERIAALEMMATALNTPPDGGLPIATVDAPTEAPMAPVAECTPDTPPAVSRAKPAHDLKVGDVVRSSWGYDQTNVNHYQVVKVIGKRTVEVRELAEHNDATGGMAGRVSPIWGEFVGEPMRRSVDRHGNVNILREKFGRASKIEPVAIVHGVRCYASTDYSSYA